MACLPNQRLQDYYKSNIQGKTFLDELLYCFNCNLHFSVNLLDPNGHGIRCPKCHSKDEQTIINVGCVEVKLIGVYDENNCFTDFESKDGSIFIDQKEELEQFEPEYSWFGQEPQKDYK
ncbi:hypothetical protein [Paenibacillus agricola]|uniref:Replication restart DNA helicase PriA n=1 Tax=Paenibacillus agricola TaxID=2716264 RepID=A0ABX0JH78_9BACL|nr:hypothetical protein [Paenibacillus agricola]NHN35552.1 hypothetical protein [Paenibacillus agricola]